MTADCLSRRDDMLGEMASAFQRLVRRVLDGQVVPFLGAGISMSARIPDDPSFEPTVSWMAARVHEDLEDRLPLLEGSLEEQIRRALKLSARCPSAATEKPDGGDLKLDRAADVLTWLAGAAQLCRILRIQDYARLAPLAAHRYLAYLAREGLIAEIITTNYDTCIEQAFQDSFGLGHAEETDCSRPTDALAVVFNLAQYRAHAGRSRSKSGDPVLHLYKINGDAADYQAALQEHERHREPHRLEQRAARIIVTERQLQSFRDERWARDLLADRTRSRTLLFCGFGSEEPQVRHHAMTLMDEMQKQSQPASEGTEIPNLPNAPFFVVHDSALQFNQLQILVGFALAHARPGTPANSAPIVKLACANALLGAFAQLLEEASDDTPKEGDHQGKTEQGSRTLPADLFFEKLFQAVWMRRLEGHLRPGSTLDGWLRSLVVEHRAWADWLLERTGLTTPTPRELTSTEARDNARRALFGIGAQIFPREDGPPTLFMRWMHAVGTGGSPLLPSVDYYFPLHDAPLLIPLTLMLCLWIAPPGPNKFIDPRYVEPAPGLGLKVRLACNGTENNTERFLYLVREGVRENPSLWRERPADPTWLIAIPGNDRVSQHPPSPVVTGDPLVPVRIERRTAAGVLRAARRPEAPALDVLTRIFSTLPKDEMP